MTEHELTSLNLFAQAVRHFVEDYNPGPWEHDTGENEEIRAELRTALTYHDSNS